VANVHRQGALPNIFLFATARGGSTWLMEILASQPGMKYYDEPFNIRRKEVARVGLFDDWRTLMPDSGDPDRIIRYLNDLAAGKYAFMNPRPLRPNHRVFTNRIVFKVHELEHLMGRIARDCNGQIVLLLRHPIPTTLSRKVLPRMEEFLESRYYSDLIGSAARLNEIRQIAATGDHLQRGTINWCYNNLVPLRFPDFDGLTLTYEELALNPVASAGLLMDRLKFDDRDAMLAAFGRPSHNINMSSAETRQIMNDADERRRRLYLVNKWQSKVSAAEKASVSAIMDLFGIDAYSGDRVLPHARYLHFADTARLVDDAPARPSAIPVS
jgi:hypothetical protein